MNTLKSFGALLLAFVALLLACLRIPFDVVSGVLGAPQRWLQRKSEGIVEAVSADMLAKSNAELEAKIVALNKLKQT